MSFQKCGIAFALLFTGAFWATPFLQGQSALAWFVPCLILWVSGLGDRFAPFQKAYFIGFCFHLIALYWLLNIPILIGAIAGWIALTCYAALYPAVWVWCVWQMLPVKKNLKKTPSRLLDGLAKMNWAQRQVWFLASAAVWTAGEILQSHLLGGFPWNLLGISQIDLLPIIQIASLTGVFGVSFLVVWVSLSLLGAITKITTNPAKAFAWTREIFPAGMILIAVFIWGWERIQTKAKHVQSIRIALIQPSFDQSSIWEGRDPERHFEELLKLSETALAHHPDLLVWPESAIPTKLKSAKDRVSDFVAKHRIPLVFNDTISVKSKTGERLFNAAILKNHTGTIIDVAYKHRLVPFGEYVPLANALPFLRALSPIAVDFSSGPIGAHLLLKSPLIKMGILICFEDAFPALARAAAKSSPNFLINLTNDAWFGESAAQWQHARGAAFRAIETGLPLIRCANNGITCWIDPFGRMHFGNHFEKHFGKHFENHFEKPRNVYEKGFRIFSIPFEKGENFKTPYAHYGDVFGWTCLLFSIIMILLRKRFPT